MIFSAVELPMLSTTPKYAAFAAFLFIFGLWVLPGPRECVFLLTNRQFLGEPTFLNSPLPRGVKT